MARSLENLLFSHFFSYLDSNAPNLLFELLLAYFNYFGEWAL